MLIARRGRSSGLSPAPQRRTMRDGLVITPRQRGGTQPTSEVEHLQNLHEYRFGVVGPANIE